MEDLNVMREILLCFCYSDVYSLRMKYGVTALWR